MLFLPIPKPTKVPLHFRDEVRAGLEADVKKGIIRRVPDGTPDTWCLRMVIQPKKIEEQEEQLIYPALARREGMNPITPDLQQK